METAIAILASAGLIVAMLVNRSILKDAEKRGFKAGYNKGYEEATVTAARIQSDKQPISTTKADA